MYRVAIHFWGGIGNQLFQIAAILSYAHKYSRKFVYVPGQHSQIRDGEFLWQKFPKLQELIPEESLENFVRYDEVRGAEIPVFNQDLLIFGYFQFERYFKEYRNEVIDLFRELFNISQPLPQTVGIHVRMGDYRKFPHIFYLYEADYFKRCLKLFPKSKILFVTTETAYVQEHFPNQQIISGTSFDDFSTLINCQHGVILPNSTFSWWASYLNPSKEKIVIMPKLWFKDYAGYEFNFEGTVQIDYHNQTPLGTELSLLKQISDDTSKSPAVDTSKLTEGDTSKSTEGDTSKSTEEVRVNLIENVDHTQLNTQQQVQFFLNSLDYAGKLKSREIIRLCRNHLIQVDSSTRQKIIDILGDDGTIQIDLTQITILIIARESRRPMLTERLRKYNLTPTWVDPIMDDVAIKGITKAHINAVEQGLKTQRIFCVMEDDIQFSPHFQVKFTLPAICDAFFLGTSPWGKNKYHWNSLGTLGIECKTDVLGMIQVFNMFSAHAIMFINPVWTRELLIRYKYSLKMMIPQDVASACFQSETNVLACPEPWIYQDPEFRQENITTLQPLRQYLPK